MTDLPLYERRKILEEIAPESPCIVLAEQIREGKRDYYFRVTSGNQEVIEGLFKKA